MKFIATVAEVAPVFQLLRQPQRLRICSALLERGRLTTSELQISANIPSQPQTSQIMKLLAGLGLVNYQSEGRRHIYFLTRCQAIEKALVLINQLYQAGRQRSIVDENPSDEIKTLAEIFSTLGNEERLKICQLLAQGVNDGGLESQEICRRANLSQGAVNCHLAGLQSIGLVGVLNVYHLVRSPGLKLARQWLQQLRQKAEAAVVLTTNPRFKSKPEPPPRRSSRQLPPYSRARAASLPKMGFERPDSDQIHYICYRGFCRMMTAAGYQATVLKKDEFLAFLNKQGEKDYRLKQRWQQWFVLGFNDSVKAQMIQAHCLKSNSQLLGADFPCVSSGKAPTPTA